MQGARCHVLGNYFKEFGNAPLDDADVVIIPEDVFHRYDVPGMIASGKKVVLVIDPWDDEVMRQYISEYDVSPIRASTSTETVLRLIKSLTGKDVSFKEIAEEEVEAVKPEIKKKEAKPAVKTVEPVATPEKKVEVVRSEKEFTIKINGYTSDVPQLELPALPINCTAQCVTLDELRLKWKKEEEEAFRKRAGAVLEKAELVKFAKQYYYEDPIPLPFPGGQYFVYGLSERAGRGIDRIVLDYRILMESAEKIRAEKERKAEEIRNRKLQELPEPVHEESKSVIAVAPFEGFERCIKVDTSALDKEKGKVPLLIGYALHANFPDQRVVVHVNSVNGEEVLDANFEMGSKIKDYFVNEDKGGVIVRAKMQDDDLVLEYKNRRIRIPRFFSERMNFAYAYLRYRELIDAIMRDIDKEVKRHIMENKEVKSS